jgi:hypothetical protein
MQTNLDTTTAQINSTHMTIRDVGTFTLGEILETSAMSGLRKATFNNTEYVLKYEYKRYFLDDDHESKVLQELSNCNGIIKLLWHAPVNDTTISRHLYVLVTYPHGVPLPDFLKTKPKSVALLHALLVDHAEVHSPLWLCPSGHQTLQYNHCR